MANWDHLSNIGTHPVLSSDPEVRRPHVVAACDREIDKFSTIRDQTVGLQGRTVTVTIGRNVADGRGGQGPMPEDRWQDFRTIVRQSLANNLAPDFSASYDGTGEWGGVSEDSTTFIFSGVTSTTPAADVRSWLSYLARDFGQDAIALTIGDTELVES